MAGEKSARYLALLDEALCKGDWSSVPELARKVEKHAPQRSALTNAVRVESKINAPSFQVSETDTATTTKLHQDAQASRASSFEDAYIANTTLAHLYWLLQDPAKVIEIVQEDELQSNKTESRAGLVGWLEVCTVKRNLFRLWAYSVAKRQEDARACYQYVVSKQPATRSSQLRLWTEQLLIVACEFSKEDAGAKSVPELGLAYASFKAWGDFWLQISGVTVTSDPKLVALRRQTWTAYYDFLSSLLQRNILYNPSANSASDAFLDDGSALSHDQQISARRLQRAEFRRVEKFHTSILLDEAQFPRSSGSNGSVEDWVQKAVTNWRIFGSPRWSAAALGDGGIDAASRNLLDVLYRAAAKTYHSTVILRYLFEVHAALGEFELALHAFESYSEIVSKGKAREAKTGKDEPGIESDDYALQTAANAIRMLCRYGGRKEAEKAEHISNTIISWLREQHPFSPKTAQSSSDDNPEQARPPYQPTASRVSPATLVAVFQALGLSKAQWAFYTYENEKRSSLLNDALKSLQYAQDIDGANVLTLYTLSLVLMEQRNIPEAVQHIRAAIAAVLATENEDSRQRQLVPLWHLLALCASCEDSFPLSASICENAFEQLESTAAAGMIDSLDNFDKENVLQVKMTQIILTELMDGADDAVDDISELLDAYTILFGHPDEIIGTFSSKPPATTTATTTQSLSKQQGHMKTLTGSLKARSSRSIRSKPDDTTFRPDTAASVATTAQATTSGDASGAPISITVTNEDGVHTDKTSTHHHHRLHLPFRSHDEAGTKESAASDTVGGHSSMNGKSELANEKDIKADQTPSKAAHQPRILNKAQRRYGISVLVRVWLFIAGVYLRAESVDDAIAAVKEAGKLVELLEIDLAKSESGSSARKLFAEGWATGNGIDELWADVWSSRAQLDLAREQPFAAVESYDRALAYYPDHPTAIIGLSNILMDMYEEKLPAEAPAPVSRPVLPFKSTTLIDEARPALTRPSSAITLPSRRLSTTVKEPEKTSKEPSPAELNRLAARDRAYMLLLNLTKLGTGRDNPEAWLTLARAHELSREITKAKEALWWVVQLEESRPIRGWKECVSGGFSL